MKKLLLKLGSFLLLLGSLLSSSFLLPAPSLYALDGEAEGPIISFPNTFDPTPSENPDSTPEPAPSTPESNIPINDGNSSTEPTPEPTDQPSDSTPTPNIPINDGNNLDQTTDADDAKNPDGEQTENVCADAAGGLSWIICSAADVGSDLTDGIYGLIERFLVIKPLTTDTSSAVFRVWDYIRGLSNIIFVIVILIVILSQVTGLGINNYGIKRILPRLIIAAILVNLSYIFSAALVDASNIIGSSIGGLFDTIITDTGIRTDIAQTTFSDLTNILVGGGSLAAAGLAIMGTGGVSATFWTLGIALVGAIFSVIIGFITIGLRQAVVMVLVMISPLAFIAFLFPNTEKWFSKWKDLLFQMIFFYPMFAFLFHASRLAGYAIIATSGGDFLIVVLGLAVQVFPLFLSVSLLKMSGTVLGSVSNGLSRLTNPAQKSFQGWALSHAEQSRARYLAKDAKGKFAPGSRLRQFLAKNQALRELDTGNNTETFKNRAREQALNRVASYKGINAQGKDVWRTRANRFTRNAKQNAVQALQTDVASRRLKNTIDDSSHIFNAAQGGNNRAIDAYSKTGAFQFTELSKQEFWKENIAQGDQEFLIGQYLKAIDAGKGSTDYNRLITGAAGSRTYAGETTILGQVLQRSVAIENQRRREAAVVLAKFDVSKEIRAMAFNHKWFNDNGYATDENGRVIEDEHFHLLPGEHYTPYDKYLIVHKDTNKEISREVYAELSDQEKENYRKVKYATITNDKGKAVQYVFEDDAAYMKEMLRYDIAIGDPINMRYLEEIGRKHLDHEHDAISRQFADQEKEGLLRRYHSTISAAILETKFKEHAAEATSMLSAQTNHGNVTTHGQMNIARAMSLSASGKASAYWQNDACFIEFWTKVANSLDSDVPGERFEDYFPDSDIALYRDQNGKHLDGLRLTLDENKQPTWQRVSSSDPTITLDDKRNFVKHQVLPKVLQQVTGFENRKMSPSALENQKPGATRAHEKLAYKLNAVSAKNYDPDIPFTERPNPAIGLHDTPDPNSIRSIIAQGREEINTMRGVQTPTPYRLSDLGHLNRQIQQSRLRNDPETIRENITDIAEIPGIDFQTTLETVISYLSENDLFRDRVDFQEMLNRYLDEQASAESQDDVINHLTHSEEHDEELKEAFLQEIDQLIDLYGYSD